MIGIASALKFSKRNEGYTSLVGVIVEERIGEKVSLFPPPCFSLPLLLLPGKSRISPLSEGGGHSVGSNSTTSYYNTTIENPNSVQNLQSLSPPSPNQKRQISILKKGKESKKTSRFIFVLLPRRSPTLPLQVGLRVGFYHLAAGLICATALLGKA